MPIEISTVKKENVMNMSNTDNSKSAETQQSSQTDSVSQVRPDSILMPPTSVWQAENEPLPSKSTSTTRKKSDRSRRASRLKVTARKNSFPWIPLPASYITGKAWSLLSADARSLVISFVGAYWEDGCRGLPVSATSLARLMPIHWRTIQRNLDVLQSFLELDVDESQGEPIFRCSLLDEAWLHAFDLSEKRRKVANDMHAKARAIAEKPPVQLQCYSEQQQDPHTVGLKQQQPQAPILPPHEEPPRENPVAATDAKRGNLPVPVHGQDAGGQDPDAAALELLTGAEIGLSHRLSRRFIDAEFYRNSCTGNPSWRLLSLKAAVEKLRLKIKSGTKVDNAYGFLKTLYEEAVAEKGDSNSHPESVQNQRSAGAHDGQFCFDSNLQVERLFSRIWESKDSPLSLQARNLLKMLLPSFNEQQQIKVVKRILAVCEEKQLMDTRGFPRYICDHYLTEICERVYKESQ
jgi:hypothetical protein